EVVPRVDLPTHFVGGLGNPQGRKDRRAFQTEPDGDRGDAGDEIGGFHFASLFPRSTSTARRNTGGMGTPMRPVFSIMLSNSLARKKKMAASRKRWSPPSTRSTRCAA